MVLGVNSLFRSKPKWRHRSTTIEIVDVNDPAMTPTPNIPKIPSNITYTAPDIKQQNTSKKKNAKEPPFNSDSLLNGIGDYIFSSPLGDGKFSKVMLARHSSTGEEVAIKMINKRAHEYRVMSRLVREVTLMEVLNHPNIVKLKETFETADALYLVMEYVPGVNLEEYLKKLEDGAMSEDQARVIIRQLIKAIDHCHSRWVVHRDLKAPNVLLTPDFTVKLADFGLGNRFGLHRLTTICGSMLYYSPEIISARAYVGPEVDCWCLGIILFRMTAGFEPFAHAKTVSELKKYVIGRHYKIPAHLSPALQGTIRKCLSTERYDRLCLRSCLADDPWLNDNGKLPDVFTERITSPVYHASEVTQVYAASGLAEDKLNLQLASKNSKLQCRKDLEEERRQCAKVHKTIVYHIISPSTYFTSAAPHSSKIPIHLDAQSTIRAELHDYILITLKQVKVQPVHYVHLADLKSPISHLLRKFKRADLHSNSIEPQQKQLRKAASALNLSQLYQRVTKDYISYFTIQCNVTTGSSTTFVSGYSNASTYVGTDTRNRNTIVESGQGNKRLTRRFSMALFPHYSTQSESNMLSQQDDDSIEQDKHNQTEMIKILRLICELLGITYYQPSPTQLICLLTLRNYKAATNLENEHSKHQSSLSPHSRQPHSLLRSKLFASNDKLSDVNRMNTQISSISKNSSSYSSMHTGWFSRQMHRLSAQFNHSQSIVTLGTSSSAGPGMILGNSSYDLLSLGRMTQEQQIKQGHSVTQTKEEDQSENKKPQDTNSESGSTNETDGYAMLTIDITSVSSSKYNEDGTPLQVVAIRYSKLKGSTKVFKLAKGWIQMILTSSPNEQQTKPNYSYESQHINRHYMTDFTTPSIS
ncbi:hypothetical protein BDB01DRAFT_51772 [Pilobolus umbonatus]|nr:hypothetical protein BDB01DRAFT_51772 [Pilobolus umbonatus]